MAEPGVSSAAYEGLVALSCEVARLGGRIDVIRVDQRAFRALMGAEAAPSGSVGGLHMPFGGVRVECGPEPRQASPSPLRDEIATLASAADAARYDEPTPAAAVEDARAALAAALVVLRRAEKAVRDEMSAGTDRERMQRRECLPEARARLVEALMWAERAAKP